MNDVQQVKKQSRKRKGRRRQTFGGREARLERGEVQMVPNGRLDTVARV